MWKCPVCEEEIEELVCKTCGFDSSRDYGRFPSFRPLSGSVQALSERRKKWEKRFASDLRCKGCDSRRFALSTSTGAIRCLSCGKVVTGAQLASLMAVWTAGAGSEIKGPVSGETKATTWKISKSGFSHGSVTAGKAEKSIPGLKCRGGKYIPGGLQQEDTPLPEVHYSSNPCDVAGWMNVAAIAAAHNLTVGLFADGTVVAAGMMVAAGSKADSLSRISTWRNITAIATGGRHVVGLRKDGTVVATGNNVWGQCNVKEWKNIKAIAAGCHHTVGLCEDGTVVATGRNTGGQLSVEEWKNVKAISAGDYHTVGLCMDGTVLAVSDSHKSAVFRWNNMTAISATDYHTVGLQADGTVQTTEKTSTGTHPVNTWRNIKAVAAGSRHTVGLLANGTVMAAGSDEWGQCKVKGWRNITAVGAGERHTVGLCANGTVVAVGNSK